MAIRNSERVFVSAVRSFAESRDLSLLALSDDWLIVLQDDDGHRHTIFGYDIGLNGSNVARIANDKAAAAELLDAAGVPVIPHRLFLSPDLLVYTGGDGIWLDLRRTFDEFGHDAVIKPNDGTSGKDVLRIRNYRDLERAAHRLTGSARSLALSPFIDIRDEVRFVILDGRVQLAYAKSRPSIRADGVTSVRDLIARAMTPEMGPSLGEWLEDALPSELDSIPEKDTVLPVGWRHNLGQGGRVTPMPPDGPGAEIAIAAASALNLRFGSVDIACTNDGRELVMEVNAGVMLEHFARHSDAAREQATRIYAKALSLLFAA